MHEKFFEQPILISLYELPDEHWELDPSGPQTHNILPKPCRGDLVAGSREAGDTAFDVLISRALSYVAHASEFSKLGRIPVLKAHMNAELHKREDLMQTDKANLFVVFGEPDIDILDADDGKIQVKINGVDVFHPNTGKVRSDGAEGVACWFVDTDYSEERFFVRHA